MSTLPNIAGARDTRKSQRDSSIEWTPPKRRASFRYSREELGNMVANARSLVTSMSELVDSNTQLASIQKTLNKTNRRPAKGYNNDLGAEVEVVRYEPEQARQSVGDTITDPIERMLVRNKNIKIVSGKGGQLIDGKSARATYMRRTLGSRWQARSRGQSRDGNRIGGAHRITISSLGRIGKLSRDNPDIINPETARLRGVILGVPGDIVQAGSYLAQTLRDEPDLLRLKDGAVDWRDLPEIQKREKQVCAMFLAVLEGFQNLNSDLSLWEGYHMDMENEHAQHTCTAISSMLSKLREIVAQLVPEKAHQLLENDSPPNEPVISVDDVEQYCKVGRPSVVASFITKEVNRARLATHGITPPAMVVRSFLFMRRADWPLLCSLNEDLDKTRGAVRQYYREIIGVTRGRWKKINTLIMPVISRAKIREKLPAKLLGKDSKVATALKQSLQGTAVSNYRGKFAQMVAEGEVAQTDWTGITVEKSRNLRGYAKRDKESPLTKSAAAVSSVKGGNPNQQSFARTVSGTEDLRRVSSVTDDTVTEDKGLAFSRVPSSAERPESTESTEEQQVKDKKISLFKGRKGAGRKSQTYEAGEVQTLSYKPCHAVIEIQRLSKEAKERRQRMELQDRFCSDRFYHDRMPLVELPEELDLGRGQATRENLLSFMNRVTTPLAPSIFERRQREKIKELQKERRAKRRDSDVWWTPE